MAKNKKTNCKVTFENEDGQKLFIDFKISDESEFDITGSPENLKEHKGIHASLAKILIDALSKEE